MKKLIIFLLLGNLFYSGTEAAGQKKITFGEIKKEGRVWGIDISHYQVISSWEKIEKEKPHFVFLKATEGSTITDNKYSEYYKKFRKIGIPVGSYHFFSYRSDGKQQAKKFISVLKYQKGDLPPVLDVEYAPNMPSDKLVIGEISAFIKAVCLRTGKYPIVYCDYDYYLRYLKHKLHENCKLWIVDYAGRPDCEWTFWQTTDKFRHEGIKGFVDFNLFNGSKTKLKQLRKK